MQNKNIYRRLSSILYIWSGLAAVFLVVGGQWFESWQPTYLVFNLVLALVPWGLLEPWFAAATRWGWRDVRPWLWGIAWLAFVPNTFYLVTDLMHIADTQHGFDPLYAAVLFGLLALVGVVSGLANIWMVHGVAEDRLGRVAGWSVAIGLLTLCSIGLYVGKVLRWNSWDPLLRPGELARDVAMALGNPAQAALFVAMSLVLLIGLYAPIHRFLKK